MTAGCLAAAAATAHPDLIIVTVAALLLGAGYGLCLIIGLREVEQLAASDELGAVIAVFYSLAYSGLALPYLLTLIAPHVGYPAALLGTAGAAALTLLLVQLRAERPKTATPSTPSIRQRTPDAAIAVDDGH